MHIDNNSHKFDKPRVQLYTCLMKQITITTLIENDSLSTELACEPGLSLYIETPAATLLFDTGDSGKFLNNAEKLQCDLTAVDHIIISHGHHDHAGGVKPLITYLQKEQAVHTPAQKAGGTPAFWTGTGFTLPKFARSPEGLRPNGINFSEAWLQAQGISWNCVEAGKTEISPGIWLVTGFSPRNPLEPLNPRFVVSKGAGSRKSYEDETFRETKSSEMLPAEGDQLEACQLDDFHDEVLLVLETSKGLVVLVGCSHPGILTMLQTVNRLFSEPLYALMGGLHLKDADETRITGVVEALKDLGIKKLGVSHCTGTSAVKVLRENLPEFFENHAGSVFKIP